MERPKTTPKDFFLWAGAMISLYAGVVAFIALIFSYINHVFPNPLQGYYADPYQSGISYYMASLIVLAPVFLILMRIIRSSMQSDPSRREIWVRRWALFLILFVAGGAIVIDLIVLLTTFLNGEEMSVRFLLKVLVVLLVAAGGFMHFIADLWGYWEKNPQYATRVNWGVAVLVVLTILAGFVIVGTPQEARLYRYDQQKVADLQNIQWQIVTYWQQKESLPATLADLADPISGFHIPSDVQTGVPYHYDRLSPLDFRLCATFNAEDYSQTSIVPGRPVEPMGYLKTGDETWRHGVGEVCFDRSIDPERYPPFSK